MVEHIKTVVQSLGADNSVLLRVHHEAAEAGVSAVLLVVLGQEVDAVDFHVARDVFFTLEGFHLGDHELLVFSDCRGKD